MKRVQEYTNDGGQAKHACFRVALLLVVILNVYTHGEFVLKSYDMNNSPSSPLRGDFVIGWYRYQPIYPKRYSKYNTMPVHISTQHSKHKEITAENNQSADIFIESTLKRPKMIADYQFAERLRQSQKNDSFPLVNDIIVMGNNKKWIFYVIMNNGNALPAYQKLRNMNVKLVCGNHTIRNSFKVGKEDNIRLLKYVVNDALLSNTVSLIDGATSWKYISLPFQVLPVQPKRKVAICAYISDYNTANEIKSFLAFYLIQKVDTIIFYCAVNFNFFYNLLKKEIENGYVILYSYPWPLTNAYGKIQRSIQISQMNSCYYRHRSFFEYIVMIDVDEYMFSELFPNSLYKGIEYSFRINPGKKDLAVGDLLQNECNRLSLIFTKAREIVRNA